MGYIYRMYDIRNGMSYIGQTTRLQHRIKEHLYYAKNDNTNSKVYSYFKNVPEEAIGFEILCECDDDKLDSEEIRYIEMYDSYNNGLNSTTGGHTSIRKRNPDIDDIFKKYLDGESIVNLAIDFGYSHGAIVKIIKDMKINNEFNGDRKIRKIERTGSKPKAMVCYDKYFNILHTFKSMTDAICWLGKTDHRSGYIRLKIAAKNGNIAYGYRWAFMSDLTYSDMIFNTIFDIEAYKNGGQPVKNSNGLYEVENETVSLARKEPSKNYCKICGKEISKTAHSGFCRDCLKIDSYGDRQVPPDLKISYPFVKEELQKLYPKYTANSIAKHCSVSYTTVNKWLKKFGLK